MTHRLLNCVLALLLTAARPDPLAAQVDHHQHLLSDSAARLVPQLRPFDGAELLGLLDAAGIRQAVILSLAYQYGNPNRPPVENEYEQVRAENDWTSAQVALHPDRLRGFCAVNPLRDYALEEIARCARDPHLSLGLKLHFGNSDVTMDDSSHVAQLRRVFRAADENGMAIVVHMRPSVTRRRPYGASQARTFLNELLPAAPNSLVQIAHLAGSGGYAEPAIDEALSVFSAAITEGDSRMMNVYFDVSGVLRPGQPEAQRELIASRIRQLGVERVLYGSDGAVPGNTPPEALARFRELPLTEAELRTIAENVAPYMK